MMEKNKQKTIRVELVGGPLCGSVVDWPEGKASLNYERYFAKYEFEGADEKGERFTAIYKGWVEI